MMFIHHKGRRNTTKRQDRQSTKLHELQTMFIFKILSLVDSQEKSYIAVIDISTPP